MPRRIQICASSNDLFSLDDEGNVYRYDFNKKAWVLLAEGRVEAGSAQDPGAPHQRDAGHGPRRAEA